MLSNLMTAENPTIFAIKRYALHDGPNIRTTIFFKGCPLSCHWCHNPEGIAKDISIVSLSDKCVGCSACIENCPTGALSFSAKGIDRDITLCSLCGDCVDVCPALSHETTGWTTDISRLMAEIEKDLPFYDNSGGGVTFSGGEPLMQPDFLLELLQECGNLEIHRAVDTSGFAPTATLMNIAEQTDLFLFDIKHMDSEKHLFYTGVPNELILHNLKALSTAGHPINARFPLISDVNDDENNIRETAIFLAACPTVKTIDILPYHPSARIKYKKLEIGYQGEKMKVPENEKITSVVSLFSEFGLEVRIGG